MYKHTERSNISWLKKYYPQLKKDGSSQPYKDHGGTVTANGDGAKGQKNMQAKMILEKLVKGLKIVAPAGATKS